MASTPAVATTPASNKFWTLRSQSVATRLLGFIVLLVGLEYVSSWLAGMAGITAEPWLAMPGQLLALLAIRLLPFLTAYWILARIIEARTVDELAAGKLLPHASAGFLLGCVLMAIAAMLLWLAGCYRIDGTNPGAPWLRSLLLIGIVPGVTEEIVSRGVLYRIVEQRFGTWIALVVSALVFGGLHAWNPNATVWSCMAIAIEAGLLLGVLYTLTRSLYVCIGVHAGWNFMRGTVLGIPVSGIDQPGLLASSLRGPEWLSGGVFGAEASVLTVALLGGFSAALIVYASRRGLMSRSRRHQARIRIAPGNMSAPIAGLPD